MNKADDPKVAAAIAQERRKTEAAVEDHPVVSQEEWVKQRLKLMEKEKQHMREGDELAAEVRGGGEGSAATVNLEGLERSLTVLEEKLYAALRAAAPEALLVGLKEHAALELAPYRSRMGAVQLRQVEQQFERKQLLVHYNLPRLSLFYMSQQ